MLESIGFSLIILLVLLFLGLPVAYCFAIAAAASISAIGLGTSMLTSVGYQSIDSFPLMAIPFFIVAGELMTQGGLSKRLIDFANLLVGKIRGGLTHVVVVASLFFGALSGSSVATVAAIGSIMIDDMGNRGYNRTFSTAVICASGFLGVLIPPSVPGITYAVATGQSVGAVFLATAVPGVLIGLAFMIVNYFYAPKYIDMGKVTASAENVNVPKVIVDSLPALLMPVIILGGIYGGVFTPTEAAAVACAYALLVGFFLKNLKINILAPTLKSAAVGAAVLLILISMVGMMGRIFTMAEVPAAITALITGFTTNPIMILLLVNVVLIFAGMLLETNTAIIILAPMLMPLMQTIGVDMIHFAAIMVTNLAIGMITPPFSANVFVGSRVSGIPFAEIIKYIWPYLLASLIVLVFITYIPGISLWLPNLLK